MLACRRIGCFLLALATVAGPSLAGSFDYFAPALREPSVTCRLADKARRLPVISKIEAEWYPQQWSAAKEPSLYLQSRAPHSRDLKSYRFTWLRSFDAPVFVRVDQLSNGDVLLTAKQLSGRGGYEPGVINAKVERLLTPMEKRRLSRTLAAANELHLPPTICRMGYDGAQWLFEANDAGVYRYVARWTPKDGPLHDLGDVLLGFTGWKFEDKY